MTSKMTPVSPAATGPGGPKKRRNGKKPEWRKAFEPKNLADTFLAGYLPIVIALLIIVLPLAWMVLSSFKPPSEIVTLDPALFPLDPTTDNYATVADRVPLLTVLGNSVIVTVIGATVKVVLAITTAYALVFIRVPGVNLIFLGILVALMVPPEVSMLPNYITISGLGGRNTLWGIILPGLGTAFGTFLLRQYFLTIPRELEDAAVVDGANHWQIYLRVIMPLSGPALSALAIFAFLTNWNSFLYPLIVTTRVNMSTLTVGLNTLQGQYNTAWTLLMAGSVIALLPILLVFIFAQRYFIAGITMTGLGGR